MPREQPVRLRQEQAVLRDPAARPLPPRGAERGRHRQVLPAHQARGRLVHLLPGGHQRALPQLESEMHLSIP